LKGAKLEDLEDAVVISLWQVNEKNGAAADQLIKN
jgi:hypothetical protein